MTPAAPRSAAGQAMGFHHFDAANATAADEAAGSGSGPDATSVGQLLRRREALRAALYDRETPPLLVLNEASARGLDLKINVVFLWDLPTETASYLHMAGRTGRAGQASLMSCDLTAPCGGGGGQPLHVQHALGCMIMSIRRSESIIGGQGLSVKDLSNISRPLLLGLW